MTSLLQSGDPGFDSWRDQWRCGVMVTPMVWIHELSVRFRAVPQEVWCNGNIVARHATAPSSILGTSSAHIVLMVAQFCSRSISFGSTPNMSPSHHSLTVEYYSCKVVILVRFQVVASSLSAFFLVRSQKGTSVLSPMVAQLSCDSTVFNGDSTAFMV